MLLVASKSYYNEQSKILVQTAKDYIASTFHADFYTNTAYLTEPMPTDSTDHTASGLLSLVRYNRRRLKWQSPYLSHSTPHSTYK